MIKESDADKKIADVDDESKIASGKKSEKKPEKNAVNSKEKSNNASIEAKDTKQDALQDVDSTKHEANAELKWVEKVQLLEDELKKSQDLTLRTHAELQNTQRRAQLDIEKAHKFALEKFISDLIPVVDSLEKGIESVIAQPDIKADTMLEGMKLTLQQLLSVLKKANVEQIDPVGQPFDPNFHEAMSMVPNPKTESNTVIDVFQKGYILNKRVIRPAMVVVAK